MKRFWEYAVILTGLILTAFSISVFYLPNKIVSGGVSGISTILYHIFRIPPGASFIVINIILLLLALFIIGKDFVIKTIFGAVMLSVLVQVFSYVPPITQNTLLATVFGAVLYGMGIGLTLSQGASTGGTDILSRLLQRFFPYIKIGRMLMITDLIVIIISFAAFQDIDLALWGIIALFISSFSVDWIIQKLNISKLAFIVTDYGVEISQKLVTTSPRGVTILHGTGAYTMQDKTLLICALKENELPMFQKKVLEIDKEAFIIYSQSEQIVGNGFHVYR